MASNSPFNGGVSSLLKSATSTASTIADFQDKEKAFDWADSAYTDDAYNAYSDYLTGRINTLQNSGNISDASKALTLMGTLRSATHSNVSAGITRENIQVMAGNATPQDKLNLINGQYQRASENGDLTLAQSLMSQSYSLSQTIQYNQQQATSAYNANATANATANAKGEASAVTVLQDKLAQFSTDYAHAGAKDLDSVTKQFIKDNQSTFDALGVHLRPGVQPNYFDLVDGVKQAIYAHDSNAYTYLSNAGSSSADTYAQFDSNGNLIGGKLYDITHGTTSTAFGKLTPQQLAQAQADPLTYHLKADPDFLGNGQGGDGGKQNPQTGYKFDASLDANGKFTGITPTVAESPWITVPAGANAQIQALGLQVVGGTAGTNGVQVAASNGKGKPGDKDYQPATPDYLKKVLPANTVVHLLYSPNGQVQFEGDAKDGQGKAVYTITKDSTGKTAVYESSNMGDRLVGGDKGYNPFDTNGAKFEPMSGTHKQSAFSIANAEKNVSSWFGPAASHLNSLFGHASAQELIGGATDFQVAQQNAAAARALISQPVPALPNISLPQATPLPSIGINTAPAPPKISVPTYGSQAVTPKTVNPQQPTVNPQSPGSFNLQGGGGIRLQ